MDFHSVFLFLEVSNVIFPDFHHLHGLEETSFRNRGGGSATSSSSPGSLQVLPPSFLCVLFCVLFSVIPFSLFSLVLPFGFFVQIFLFVFVSFSFSDFSLKFRRTFALYLFFFLFCRRCCQNYKHSK